MNGRAPWPCDGACPRAALREMPEKELRRSSGWRGAAGWFVCLYGMSIAGGRLALGLFCSIGSTPCGRFASRSESKGGGDISACTAAGAMAQLGSLQRPRPQLAVVGRVCRPSCQQLWMAVAAARGCGCSGGGEGARVFLGMMGVKRIKVVEPSPPESTVDGPPSRLRPRESTGVATGSEGGLPTKARSSTTCSQTAYSCGSLPAQ